MNEYVLALKVLKCVITFLHSSSFIITSTFLFFSIDKGLLRSFAYEDVSNLLSTSLEISLQKSSVSP